MLYQYLTSDHFPLSLYLNVPYTAVPNQTSDDVQMSTVLQKVDWGQLPVETVSNYIHPTEGLLKDLLADDVITCSGGHCTNQGHVDKLSNTYGHIMNCLQKADYICIPKKHKNFLLLFQVGINICQSLIMNLDKHILFGVVTINLDRVLFMKLWRELERGLNMPSDWLVKMMRRCVQMP